MPESRGHLQVKMALFFGLALVIAGAFMPWAEMEPLTENGTDRDGIFTLIFSIIAALIAFFDRRPRGMLIAVSLAALVLVVGLTSYIDVSGSTVGEVGIGIYMTIAGAAIATAAAGYVAFSMFKKPVAPSPPAEPPAAPEPPATE